MQDPIEFRLSARSLAAESAQADVRRPLWPFDMHRRMAGWLLPRRASEARLAMGRGDVPERRLRMALTAVTSLVEALASTRDALEVWSRYQAGRDGPADASRRPEPDRDSDACVDFPSADRQVFLLRRALGNHAPAGLDFSILERIKVGLAALRAHAPEAFAPTAQARGDIDAALLQTVDGMVRNELRIRWERASLIRGRAIPRLGEALGEPEARN